RGEELRVVTEGAFEDEAAIDERLLAHARRELGRGCAHRMRLELRGLDETLLARQLHDFVAQRVRLIKELFDVGALELRRPAQHRAQNLDLFEEPRVRDSRAAEAERIEEFHGGGPVSRLPR